MKIFAAGCLLGLAGSVHCVMMCGPLVAVTSTGGGRGRDRVISFIAYHSGRGATYQTIALLAVSFGQVFARAGLGAVLSVGCGVLMLWAAVPAGLANGRVQGALMRRLRAASRVVAQVAPSRPLLARFLGGVVNGWLPCGLVYAAALTATTMGGAGALTFMAGFGVGTLPALALVAVSAARWLPGMAGRLRWLPHAARTIAGLLLIARGLGALGVAPEVAGNHVHHTVARALAPAPLAAGAR